MAEAQRRVKVPKTGEVTEEGEEKFLVVGEGVRILQEQYLAGYKEDRAASFPTVPQLDVHVPCAIDGTIDDVYRQSPELVSCLYNDVKLCSCGKPCAYTMTVCNSCGKDLPEEISKSENVFSAFLFGVKLASKGFPYTISIRRETEDVLVFDDMLQLCPCHLNAIPKRYYIPDFRYLLLAPKQALELLDALEVELRAATQVFLENPAFRNALYKQGVTDEFIQQNIVACFNFPPSQFQLHVQWLVPPLTPFQYNMALKVNHFHEGRCFPLSYVRKILAVGAYPDGITKETPIQNIIAYYAAHGVDYKDEWSKWFESICLGGTEAVQTWNPDDFQYVVQDGKVFTFSVEEGQVTQQSQILDADPIKIQAKDKVVFQNYGRPFDEFGKPSGTYIQKPLVPRFGDGGYLPWPPS